MKYTLLLTFIISFSAHAQDHQVLFKNFKMINEINGKTENYKACASDDPNAPEYCKNLYNYICAQKKISDKRGELDQKLMTDYWKKLPQSLTHKRFNDTARVTHQIAEESVYKLTGLTRSEITKAMNDVKSSLHKFIKSTKLINKQYKKAMIENTGSVKLVYGQEYVESLLEYGKKQAPHIPEEQIRTEAYKIYISACGMNGLEVNAFYEGGRLVLCPGLLISAAEYGRPKDEILAGLKFTIGHEIGHAVDTAVYPDIYKKMQKCYEDVSGNKEIWNENMSAEISADYWGALTLGDKLNSKNPDTNAKIVALAVDGFCSAPITEGSPHPEGAFRINQILAKHPYVARALNCAPAGSDAPYCSINGAYIP